MRFNSIIYATVVAGSSVSSALAADRVVRGDMPEQSPSSVPMVGQVTSSGCWSDKGNMTVSHVKDSTISSGSCRESCKENQFLVMALQGNKCYCGMLYPPKDTISRDENCDFPCPGFAFEACGGTDDDGYYSVFNMGYEVDVSYYEGEEDGAEETGSPSSHSSKSSPSSTVTSGTPTTTPTDIGTGTTSETPVATTPDDAAVGGFNLGPVVGSLSAAVAAIVISAAL